MSYSIKFLINFLVSILFSLNATYQKTIFLQTFSDISITNDKTLQFLKLTETDSMITCYSKCARISQPSRTVAKYEKSSFTCFCFTSTENSLRDFEPTLRTTSAIYMYAVSLHPTVKIPDPCESENTNPCVHMAVCSFDGRQPYCMCQSHLNGHGILCTSFKNIEELSAENIQLTNTRAISGQVAYLMDKNTHDSSSMFDEIHCVEMKPLNTTEGSWTIKVDLFERHFVKAVGFYNRKDSLAG
ncbi:uncharacterized protein LOC142343081 [Convolutriloba macropyga]|uniref:uncharacterized protein LOC142343081 n=1 Tax=Convolutriloba macropyga TaxID=536237 RepID=UPI003F51CCF0